MRLRIILLLILSHFLCDFILQNEKILKLRFSKDMSNNLKGNAVHSLMHFFVMFFIMGLFGYSYYFKTIFYIAVLHFAIDEVKTLAIKFKKSLENNIALFVLDQLLHMIVILIVVCDLSLNRALNSIYEVIKIYPDGINLVDRYIIISIVFILCTWGAGIFIMKYIKSTNLNGYTHLMDKGFIIVKKSSDVNSGARNGGFIIGILERIFILIGISIGQPSMIGFVLTAKSIARFKKLDDDSFVEYFIIGTFISFIIAIIGGIIINTLNVIPIIK
ncbi:DUF3307 domain-containing protein [uncultured Clostridium sp.]|uniref:DUF3307 domain-containing protein n=1 Tax=uncultured Clostridium sp. TaxID=59620 RepID=UPI0028EDF8A2|nr:DUF3307 domain-containing protein [uncultured Clostridium sp.]